MMIQIAAAGRFAAAVKIVTDVPKAAKAVKFVTAVMDVIAVTSPGRSARGTH